MKAKGCIESLFYVGSHEVWFGIEVDTQFGLSMGIAALFGA